MKELSLTSGFNLKNGNIAIAVFPFVLPKNLRDFSAYMN